MSVKHHQAVVSKQKELINKAIGSTFNSHMYVYDTRHSFPSKGIEFCVFEDHYTTDAVSAPTRKAYNAQGLVSSGHFSNIIFDWEGGGPEGVQTPRWQLLMGSTLWGCDTGSQYVEFKVVYSGNLELSVNNSVGDYFTTNPDTQLTTTLIDDWDFKSNSSIKDTTVGYTFGGVGCIGRGGMDFRIRYWNGTSDPHLLVYVKRDLVDDDYVLLGGSTASTYDGVNYTDTFACSRTLIDDLLSWEINRDHDKITGASVTFRVPDISDTKRYDPSSEKFGDIGKGSYIELYGGYDGTASKRFVGNVSGGVEISRDDQGALVSLQCEGVLSFLLDSINFSFPNNATYSYSEYFTNENLYTEPAGEDRERFFDNWDINKLIKALAVQSGIDPWYLKGTRKYFDQANNIIETSIPLLRDLNISLSRNSILTQATYNENLKKADPIWQYDFGQDTAYDICKDVLSKYGFYLSELSAGTDCGKLELIEIESPISVSGTVNDSLSTNITSNVKVASAEGFLGTRMNPTSSTLVVDWTGNTLDLVMGIGAECSDAISVSYKVDPGDADWTNIGGYISDGTYIDSYIISTYNADATTTRYFYDGISASTGENETVFKLAYGIDGNGYLITGLAYGAHRLRLTKTSDATAFFDSVFVYDYGNEPYKKYTTYDSIENLSIQNEIADIRNDIVVLGATYGAFSNVADPDVLDEVKDRYITSRVVDTRSIYDEDYKYYVGRRKQFVIEEPTIVTQERADWLSLYLLKTYRQTPINVEMNIPADMGLQLYDAILVEDVKTYSVDSYKELNVYSIKESFNDKAYTMGVSASTRAIPVSFRQRELITPDVLSSVFNNCPIAFEKMTVPIKSDRSGYDPMTSDDGLFIEFEWTQLVPGEVNLEVFDRAVSYGGVDSHQPYYGRIAGEEKAVDNLIAVPFLSQGEQPGRYKARWDGVHERYDKNTKFKDTVYELNFKVPDGHGFFARTRNTPVIDSVSPIAVDDEDWRAAKVVYFPAYPVIKYFPTYSEYSDVSTVYYFGQDNGTSSVNGVANTSNDITQFEISEFDLEPRLPIFWGFSEEYINTPADGEQFAAPADHPYRGKAADGSSYIVSSDYESNDATCKVFNYDPRLPIGSGGYGDVSGTVYRAMPMLDETVGVKIYMDTSSEVNRRFKLLIADLEANVISVINEYVEHKVDSALVRRQLTPIINEKAARAYNYINRYAVTDINIFDFVNSVQKIKKETWEYLPKYEDRTTSESTLFVFNPSTDVQILNKFDGKLIKQTNLRNRGLSVDNVFAVPPDNIGNFTIDDLEHRLEDTDYIPHRAALYPASDPTTTYSWIFTHVNYDFFDSRLGLGGKAPVYETTDMLAAMAGLGQFFWDYYYGSYTMFRKLYNAITLSLNFKIIDRAGRLYHCVAYADEGKLVNGRHNELESHDTYARDMLPYVNRWNPFLPTGTYMTRAPETFDITNMGGPVALQNTDHVDGYFPSYEGLNLTNKIINHAYNAGDSIYFTHCTTTAPLIPLYTSNGGVPVLSVSHERDGVNIGVFGSNSGKFNSNVYNTDEKENPSTRDHTTEISAWGLPPYVIGSYPFTFNANFTGAMASCPLGGMWYNYCYKNLDIPGYANESDKEGTLFTLPNGVEVIIGDYAESQRGGIFAFLNNSPVFTLIGAGKQYADVTIEV